MCGREMLVVDCFLPIVQILCARHHIQNFGVIQSLDVPLDYLTPRNCVVILVG
jgi:hypothetical protein